jgi:hypothetical protein
LAALDTPQDHFLSGNLEYPLSDGVTHGEISLSGTFSAQPSTVPLPAALPLLGSAVLTLAAFAWRSKKVSP